MEQTITARAREFAELLIEKLKTFESVVVAFSGGVDSSVVAKAAALALGERAAAVTGISPSVADHERDGARHIAQWIGIQHFELDTHEFADPSYRANDGTRCYWCKNTLYQRLHSWCAALPEYQNAVICSGANLDDGSDYRPGLRAASEHQVRHPLQELGMEKSAVRAVASFWELPNWDKPASPCLSSRLAIGVEATPERVGRVEAAEALLRNLGLREFRVRLHPGELARLEVTLDDLPALLQTETRAKLVEKLLALGFHFVTIDLQGFRSGSLNVLVPAPLLILPDRQNKYRE